MGVEERGQLGRAPVLLQFVAVIELPTGDPEIVADEIVRLLTDTDPRRQQWLAGGSAEAAQALGFDWPVRH